MIDIFPLVLLVILFYKSKLMKQSFDIYEDYLSISTSKCYKGLFAIVVVLHHLSQRIGSGTVFSLFSKIGYLAVSVFFFYSGYGLQKSYMTKKENYFNGFLKKKVLAILIPYIIITCIYWIMYCIEGTFYSLKDILLAIIRDGKPIAKFSWYIITILNFYVFYWALMKFCKKNYYAMLIGGFIWYYIYTICCTKLGFGSWWYKTAYLIIIGMIWAIWEKKINTIIRKNLILIPIVWLIFLILFWKNEVIIQLVPISGVWLQVERLTALLFVCGIVLFSMKIKIGNKVLEFIGNISFELYMIHGLFITIFRGHRIYINNLRLPIPKMGFAP